MTIVTIFFLIIGERPFKCKVCKMSFTTNGNMHRHMRIHSKEADIEALGTKIRKKSTPTFKSKDMFFSPMSMGIGTTALNMSTPIPSREFQPKGLNFEESTAPSNYRVSPKGIKRPFDFIDCSQNWSMQKRQFLETTLVPRQPISSFIPLVVPQEVPQPPPKPTEEEIEPELELSMVAVEVRQVI